MSSNAEKLTALDLLASIDASLKELVKQGRVAQPKRVATEKELSGQWGDPRVVVNPRDWTGDNYKGQPFSACPPAFLDMLAETLEWFASQADAKGETTDKGKPVSDYKRRDAARARGWAKRIREGKHAPAATDAPAGTNGDTPAAPAAWAEEW